MYCSNCGNKVNEGLNYCNRCGGKVGGQGSEESESVARRLASSLGWIGFGGFFMLVGLVALILKERMPEGAVIAIIGMFLTTLFAICFVTLRQISKLSTGGSQPKRVNSDASTQKELDAGLRNQLEESKQPPASVVENTTRTLDKVPINRD